MVDMYSYIIFMNQTFYILQHFLYGLLILIPFFTDRVVLGKSYRRLKIQLSNHALDTYIFVLNGSASRLWSIFKLFAILLLPFFR